MESGVRRGARLTPRQEQVVLLAAGGFSSKQIARCLGITKRTVDGHFADALRRTGAKTRIELVTTSRRPQVGSCPENGSFPDKIQQTIKRRRGRPTVVTPEIIDAIRELRATHSLKAIAEKIGVSRSTLYAHMPEIAET